MIVADPASPSVAAVVDCCWQNLAVALTAEEWMRARRGPFWWFVFLLVEVVHQQSFVRNQSYLVAHFADSMKKSVYRDFIHISKIHNYNLLLP